jgi:hypothetical protein
LAVKVIAFESGGLGTTDREPTPTPFLTAFGEGDMRGFNQMGGTGVEPVTSCL